MKKGSKSKLLKCLENAKNMRTLKCELKTG